MRRSIALISAGITAFSIVLMATVAYGLRAAANSSASPRTSASRSEFTASSPRLDDDGALQTASISPEAAATLAATYLGRTDAMSVQLADYNGVQAYLVTFASGDLVYVSFSGQVLGTVPADVQMAKSDSHEKEWDASPDGGAGGGDGPDGAQEPEHAVEVDN